MHSPIRSEGQPPEASLLKRVNASPQPANTPYSRGARPSRRDAFRDPFEGMPALTTVDPMLSMTRPEYAHAERDIWGSGSKLVLSSFVAPARDEEELSRKTLSRAGSALLGAESKADHSVRFARTRESDAASIDSFGMDIVTDASEADIRATLRRRREDELAKRYLDMKRAREGVAVRDREERQALYANTRDAVKWKAVFQLHCHLTTLLDPEFDPRKPLLDEPQRRKREADKRTKARQERERRRRARMKERERERRQQGLEGLSDDEDEAENSDDVEAELGADEHAIAVFRAVRAPIGAVESENAARAAILPGPGGAAVIPGAYLRPLFSALYRQNPGTSMSKSRFITTVRTLMASWVIDGVHRKRGQEIEAVKRQVAARGRVEAKAAERRRMMRETNAKRLGRSNEDSLVPYSSSRGDGITAWDPEDGGMPGDSTSIVKHLNPGWTLSAAERQMMTPAQLAAHEALARRFTASAASGQGSRLRAGLGTVSGTMSTAGRGGIGRFGGEFAAIATVDPFDSRRLARMSLAARQALGEPPPQSSSSTRSAKPTSSKSARPTSTVSLIRPSTGYHSQDVQLVGAEAERLDPDSFLPIDRTIMDRTADLPATERSTLKLATQAFAQEYIRPAIRWLETVAEVFALSGGGVEVGPGDEESSESLNWREVLIALHVIVDPFALPHQHMRWAFAMYGSSSSLDDRAPPPIRVLSPSRRTPRLRTGWATRAEIEAMIVALPQLKPEDTPDRRARLEFIKSLPQGRSQSLALTTIQPSQTFVPSLEAERKRAQFDQDARRAKWAGATSGDVEEDGSEVETKRKVAARRPTKGRGRPLWQDGPGEEHWPGQIGREDDLKELSDPTEAEMMKDKDKAEELLQKRHAEESIAARHGLRPEDLTLVKCTTEPNWPRVKVPTYPSITCPARVVVDVIGALVAVADKRVEIEDMVMDLQSSAYLPEPDATSLDYLVEEAEAYDKVLDRHRILQTEALQRALVIARRSQSERTRDPWRWQPRVRMFIPRRPEPPKWSRLSKSDEDDEEELLKQKQEAAEEAKAFQVHLGVGAAGGYSLEELQKDATTRASRKQARQALALQNTRGTAIVRGRGGGVDALVDSSDGSLRGKEGLIQTYRLLEASLNAGSLNWGKEAETDIAKLMRSVNAQASRVRLPPVILVVPTLVIPELTEEQRDEILKEKGEQGILDRQRELFLRRAKYARLVFHVLREVVSNDPNEPSSISLVEKGKDGIGLHPRGAASLKAFDQLLLSPPLFQLLKPRKAFELRTDATACVFEDYYDPVIRAYIQQCRDTYRKAMSVRRVVRRFSSLRLHTVWERWLLFVARRRHTRYRITRFLSALLFAQRRAVLNRFRRFAVVQSAAERLQSIFRRRRAIAYVRGLRPRVEAAKKIQSIWRMFEYGTKAIQHERALRGRAAAHLQRLYRGRRDRALVRRMVQGQFRREMAKIQKVREQMALYTEEAMAARIQRMVRGHFRRREMREIRKEMWKARKAEEAMRRFEEQQELERRIKGEVERQRKLAELQAAKEAEDAEYRAEDTRRWMRMQRLGREKQLALYKRKQELLDLDAECTKRIRETKEKFASDRVSAQERRRDQIVKLLRDLALEKAYLKEAVSYLDNSLLAVPEETMGGTGWRNIEQVTADGTAPTSVFTPAEIKEQGEFSTRIEMEASKNLAQIREAAKTGGTTNKRAKSHEIDAYVAAINKLVQDELAKIAEESADGETSALRAIVEYKKAEKKRTETRYNKRLKSTWVEAAVMLQQAWRARRARDMLATSIRQVYRKRWDPERVCFIYENSKTGTVHTRRPAIFGPYDIRAEGLTPEEEEAFAAQAVETHGISGAPSGEDALGVAAAAGAKLNTQALAAAAQGQQFVSETDVDAFTVAAVETGEWSEAQQGGGEWQAGSGGEVWWQEDGEGGGYYTDGAGWWDDTGAYYLFE
jgi:hypothetical protein